MERLAPSPHQINKRTGRICAYVVHVVIGTRRSCPKGVNRVLAWRFFKMAPNSSYDGQAKSSKGCGLPHRRPRSIKLRLVIDVHITLEIWCCGYLLSKYPHLRLRIRLSHYRGQISRRRYGVSDGGHRGRPGSFQVVIPPQSSRIGGKTFVGPLPSRRESWYLFNQEHKVDPAADLSAGLSCKRLRNNSWLSLGRGPVTFL